MPGGVDVHTHLDLDLGGTRTADDFESGTAAAACGGVTTICDYAWQAKGQQPRRHDRRVVGQGPGSAHVDYGFHIILSDASEARIAEIPAIVGAGYPSFKVFTIREFGIGDEGLLRVLRAARGGRRDGERPLREQRDARPRPEGPGRGRPHRSAALRESRPALAEAEATRRVIDYAELVDAEVYIVHMSCSGAADALSAARQRGLRVSGETRPIYLGLTDERTQGGVEAAKVSAPHRSGRRPIRPRSGTRCGRATSRRSAATTRRGP